MKRIIATAVALIVAGVGLAAPVGMMPRASPELSIAEPGKPPLLLSSLRGKVVVVEFLFIRSEHCLRVAKTLNKLHGELGARGFQPVAVVFDPPNAAATGGQAVNFMSGYFKLTYPVGYTSRESVDSYLGRAKNQILNIPQMVVIDRSGMIRATSGGRGGDLTLEDEGSLHALLDSLLAEAAPVGPPRD